MSIIHSIPLLLSLVALWFFAINVADASTLRASKAVHNEKSDETERRHLLNYSKQDTASWFRSYRRQFGRVVDLCLFLTNPDSTYHNLTPETGEPCPVKNKEYWCGVGEQTCDADGIDSQTHPETKCFCENGVFQCNDYSPCMEAVTLDLTPQSLPLEMAQPTAQPTAPPTPQPTEPPVAELLAGPVCPDSRPSEGTTCTPHQTCTYDNTCCPDGSNCQDITFCWCGDDGVFGPCAVADLFCPTSFELDPVLGGGLPPPPISQDSSLTKTSWPEFVGQPCNQDMIDTIKSENLLLNDVSCIPHNSFVTLDIRSDRVRIFMDEAGNVNVTPTVG